MDCTKHKAFADEKLNVADWMIYPFSKQQFLDSSEVKVFADDNFTFDGNGRNLSKWVENTVGEAEIARYDNFSFSHSVFKRLVFQTRKNHGLFGKG